MKLLTCISTRDRPLYLENAVESFRRHFGQGDLVIVDDASADPAQHGVLDRLEQDGLRVLRRERRRDGLHGGLYDGINDAVDLALAEGYDVLQLVQDDMQFMWKDPDLEARLERLFAYEDVVQISPVFFKGVLAADLPRRLELKPEVGCYRVPSYGMSDTGFVRLDLVRAEGFRFGPSENHVSSFWRDRSYAVHVLAAPFLAWLPFPDQLSPPSAPRRSPRPLYLEPMDGEAVNRLTSRELAVIPFHEDHCRPWGWSCLAPYWFTRLGPEYFRRALRGSRPSPPRWVKGEGATFAVPAAHELAVAGARALAGGARNAVRARV
jgi:hypothetical protein